MAAGRNGRKVYRTMQGKTIDMDLLRKKNELTPAVGNARVNARGDVLGAGGKIVKKREDVVKDYYGAQPVANERGSRKQAEPTVVETEAPVAAPKKATTRAQEKTTKTTKEATPSVSELAEFDSMDDGWVEDKDGNFVKK